MKFGLVFANSGPWADAERAVALATAAEELGYESLWTVEHVVVPSGYESSYPYSKSGKMPGGEDVPVPDPLIWLAYVAAATRAITLATGILILPQRNPVILAKEAATLDVLSGGRFVLGVGVGWLEEEFDVLGVPFERRGARADEYVAAMRSLWSASEEGATFQGEFASFERAKLYPKPTRETGVPIVIGGHSEASARRAGRIGDGFFPAKGDLAHLFEVARQAAKEAGRDPDKLELTAGGRPSLEEAERLRDLGVHRITLPPFGSDGESVRGYLEQYREQVIDKLA
ncbi:MAG TPA: LLM class F420-dependent oxidoreductase [Actinobacteria bacterium]|jgi:probable F420-dependent oxidoreductase|nr:LLM class F420-dependent oxidoreductase [Actinomycetota bacterium]HCP61282.1 LLM class F420-dependent oxidoreductase [Actinomycetota bacterium]